MEKLTDIDRSTTETIEQVAILNLDLDGTILYASNSITDCFGMDPQSMVGSKIFEYCPSIDLQGPDIQIISMDRTSKFKTVTAKLNRFRFKEDELINLEVRSIQQFVGLSESQFELLNLFIEYVPSAIAMFDQEMRYLAASERWYRDYGLTGQDIIGRSHYEIFPEILEMPEWLDLHKRSLAGEVIRKSADPFTRENGETQYIEYELHPWYLANGKTGGMVMFTNVITDQVLMRKNLEKSEQRLSFLFKNLRDLVCVHDPDGTYRDISESIVSITGYSRDDLLHRNPYDFFHPDDAERVLKESHEKILAGHSRTQIEYRFRKKDGSYIWFDTTTELIRDDSGEITSLITSSRDVTEKVEAELQRQEYEQRFKKVFTTIAQGIVYQNAEGQITMANKAAEEILGLSHDTLIGRTSGDPGLITIYEDGTDFPGKDHPAMVSLRTGRSISNQIMGIYDPRKEAHTWINVSSYPIFKDGSEKPTEVYTTFTDITERHNSERVLRESEIKFRSVFDNSFSFIGLLHPDGTVVDVNNITLEYGELEREDAIGKKLWEGPWWPVTQDMNPVEKAVSIAAKGEFVRFDMELTLGEGRFMDVDFSIRPVFDDQGQVKWLIPEGRDVTKKMRMERSLSRLNAELFSILDSVPLGLIFVNTNGTIERINLKTVEMFKFSEEELLGKSSELLYLKDNAASRMRGQGMNRVIFETTCKTSVGDRFDARVINTEVLDESGSSIGYLLLIEDITEQKEAERLREEFTQTLERTVGERTKELRLAKERIEEALLAEKELSVLRSHFVSSASHQFRTPLTIIQANTELLESYANLLDASRSVKFTGYAERIQAQVKKMTDLMDDLLLFGRISEGHISVDAQEIDLLDLLHRVVNEELKEIDNQRLIIRKRGTPQTLISDPKLLSYALENLLTNALKFSPHDKSNIIVIFSDDDVVVKVEDRGIGVPKEEIDKLFQPFFRASNATDIQGTGLGLPIAKQYIERLKGQLLIESEIGEGTKVCVTLPYSIND